MKEMDQINELLNERNEEWEMGMGMGMSNQTNGWMDEDGFNYATGRMGLGWDQNRTEQNRAKGSIRERARDRRPGGDSGRGAGGRLC